MDSDALPALIRVAVFLDPVKVGVEPGYPSPVLHDVLSATADISISTISLAELHGGCLCDPELGYTTLCIPGGFAPNPS